MPNQNQKYVFVFIFVLLLIGGSVYILNKKSAPVIVTTPEPVTKLQYTNTEYGFNFTLPDNWKGFTVISDTWKGYTVSNTQGQVPTEQGPEISIRNPAWITALPTQDIPIMIFTLAQWDKLSADKFHIGAAPIGPSELGRNNTFVFALPARYNYAFPAGYGEVETILKNKPLETFSPLISCTNTGEDTPVITSLSTSSAPIGTKIQVMGCNLRGFEGDKNVWIENGSGVKGIIHGTRDENSKLIEITLESRVCQKDTSYSGETCDKYLNLIRGAYKIYAIPWGEKSNEVNFIIK